MCCENPRYATSFLQIGAVNRGALSIFLGSSRKKMKTHRKWPLKLAPYPFFLTTHWFFSIAGAGRREVLSVLAAAPVLSGLSEMDQWEHCFTTSRNHSYSSSRHGLKVRRFLFLIYPNCINTVIINDFQNAGDIINLLLISICFLQICLTCQAAFPKPPWRQTWRATMMRPGGTIRRWFLWLVGFWGSRISWMQTENSHPEWWRSSSQYEGPFLDLLHFLPCWSECIYWSACRLNCSKSSCLFLQSVEGSWQRKIMQGKTGSEVHFERCDYGTWYILICECHILAITKFSCCSVARRSHTILSQFFFGTTCIKVSCSKCQALFLAIKSPLTLPTGAVAKSSPSSMARPCPFPMAKNGHASVAWRKCPPRTKRSLGPAPCPPKKKVVVMTCYDLTNSGVVWLGSPNTWSPRSKWLAVRGAGRLEIWWDLSIEVVAIGLQLLKQPFFKVRIELPIECLQSVCVTSPWSCTVDLSYYS